MYKRYNVVLMFIIMLIFLISPHLFCQVNNNVQLLGALNPGSGGYGDIWGYTDPATGSEYALLCARNEGLYVIDVTIPARPAVTSFVPAPPGSFDAKDVKIYQTYAYVVHQSGPLQIVNLVDPANPTDTTFSNAGLAGGFHNIFIDNAGFAYVAIQTGQAAADMRILDLADPLHPVETGVYFHPNPGQGFVESHDVFVQNDTAFVSYLDGGLVILDVQDRSSPEELAIVPYPGNFTHNAWATEDGNYALTTDEVTGGHLKIWDIQDLSNIQLVSEYESRPGIIIHNIHVKGDFGFISHYVDGVKILDLADITQPVEVGFYDTFLPPGSGFNGCWGVYPYFESGTIVASDMSTGLYVLSFDSVRSGGVEGTITDAQTGLPVPDVDILFVEANKNLVSEPNGFYSLRTNEGSHTLILSKPGYFSDTLAVIIPSGPSIIHNISLEPNLADIDISRDSLMATLPVDTIYSTELIVSNVGPGGRLDYVIDDVNGPLRIARQQPISGTKPGNFNFQLDLSGIPRFEYFNSSQTTSVLPGDTIIIDPIGDVFGSGGGDIIGLYATLTAFEVVIEIEFLNDVNVDSAYLLLAVDTDFDINTGAFPGGFGQISPAQNIGSEFDLLINVPALPAIGAGPNSINIWVGANQTPNSPPVFTSNVLVAGNILSFTLPFSALNSTEGNMAIAGFGGHLNPLTVQATSVDYIPDIGNGTIGINPLGDLPWLSLSANNGSLTAGQSDTIIVTFDTNGLEQNSLFLGYLAINSNDVNEPLLSIPVTLITEPVLGIPDELNIPNEFSLSQNYPNPFNPSTRIDYQLPKKALVKLRIYNVLGQEIRTLTDGFREAGSHSIEWDGRNNFGQPVSTGIYLYKMEADNFVHTKKMALIR